MKRMLMMLVSLAIVSGCQPPSAPAPLVSNNYDNAVTDRLIVEFRVVRDTNGAVWFVVSDHRNPVNSGKTMIFDPTVPKALQLEDAEPFVLSTNR